MQTEQTELKPKHRLNQIQTVGMTEPNMNRLNEGLIPISNCYILHKLQIVMFYVQQVSYDTEFPTLQTAAQMSVQELQTS